MDVIKASLTIAITGGIASGKSTAAQVFADSGAYVLDADRLVHQAYAHPDIRAQLALACGDISSAGRVDFAALRKAILADKAILDRLERVLHPFVRAGYQQAIASYSGACLVGVVPLLFETGMDQLFEKTIAISIDPETQHKRVLARTGISEQWMQFMLARQMEQEQRNRRADAVVAGNLPAEILASRLLDLRARWENQKTGGSSP